MANLTFSKEQRAKAKELEYDLVGIVVETKSGKMQTHGPMPPDLTKRIFEILKERSERASKQAKPCPS